jgi:hypothetical protein
VFHMWPQTPHLKVAHAAILDATGQPLNGFRATCGALRVRMAGSLVCRQRGHLERLRSLKRAGTLSLRLWRPFRGIPDVAALPAFEIVGLWIDLAVRQPLLFRGAALRTR